MGKIIFVYYINMREQCNARRLIQSQSKLPKTYHNRLQELRKSRENQSRTEQINGCCNDIVKKNNTKYHTQGAVESGCHTHNLKYNAEKKITPEDKAIQQNKRINLQEKNCKPCKKDNSNISNFVFIDNDNYYV